MKRDRTMEKERGREREGESEKKEKKDSSIILSDSKNILHPFSGRFFSFVKETWMFLNENI